MKSLLFNTNPLVILPELATAIGLNEAIVLQQIHYWLKNNEGSDRNLRDGRYWTYNTVASWTKTNFPWWSDETVKRALASLRQPCQDKKGRVDRGALLLTDNYNKASFDRTLWYTIDYEELDRAVSSPIRSKCPNAEGQADPMQKVKMTPPIPETNTETIPETTLPARPAQAESLDELEYTPIEEEDDGFGSEKKRPKYEVPETDFQRELLAVCKRKWFRSREKRRVKAFKKALEVAELLSDGGVSKCLEDLEAYTGEGLPTPLPPIPSSWLHWRAGHARSHRWSFEGFLNALHDRDALVQHCRYQLRKLGVPVPPEELVKEWVMNLSEWSPESQAMKETGLPGLWIDGTGYDGESMRGIVSPEETRASVKKLMEYQRGSAAEHKEVQ